MDVTVWVRDMTFKRRDPDENKPDYVVYENDIGEELVLHFFETYSGDRTVVEIIDEFLEPIHELRARWTDNK